jgi:hypothetical protein
VFHFTQKEHLYIKTIVLLFDKIPNTLILACNLFFYILLLKGVLMKRYTTVALLVAIISASACAMETTSQEANTTEQAPTVQAPE